MKTENNNNNNETTIKSRQKEGKTKQWIKEKKENKESHNGTTRKDKIPMKSKEKEDE